jgi:hypothetical protein
MMPPRRVDIETPRRVHDMRWLPDSGYRMKIIALTIVVLIALTALGSLSNIQTK